jgi:hypothetical protein
MSIESIVVVGIAAFALCLILVAVTGRAKKRRLSGASDTFVSDYPADQSFEHAMHVDGAAHHCDAPSDSGCHGH